ncbi:molybdate ABC transporter permease subunit [Novosphingobium sp. BL-52-GroH]|uniref:molybdate ABC transporter permease subunit n=1 Tax=Novosphingobium sp. BL-52-GroH TaxID=3349877 RepID=UPI00384E4F34
MDTLSPAEWEVLILSLKVSAVAIVLALPVAFALAWVLARWRFPGKVLLDAAVHLPLVLPPVVTGWLLLIALGPNAPLGGFLERTLGVGFVFRWTGAALAAAVMALPLMVRAMRLSLEAVDRRLESAARTLGAGPWRTFAAVTLPLSANGILAALVLGLARSVGEFGATITFASNIPGETQTLPLAIYSALQMPGSDIQVARLAGLSILLSVAALVLSEWLARRSGQQKGRHVV